MRKDKLDGAGIAMLLGVQGLLAFNQILVKVVNGGLQPVFFAGLRSALAIFFVWAWRAYKGRPPRLNRAAVGPSAVSFRCTCPVDKAASRAPDSGMKRKVTLST